jgi:hypothetical protein
VPVSWSPKPENSFIDVCADLLSKAILGDSVVFYDIPIERSKSDPNISMSASLAVQKLHAQRSICPLLSKTLHQRNAYPSEPATKTYFRPYHGAPVFRYRHQSCKSGRPMSFLEATILLWYGLCSTSAKAKKEHLADQYTSLLLLQK